MQILLTYFPGDCFLLHAPSVENPPCMAAREMTHSCLVCVSHRTFHHRVTSQLPAAACRGSSSISGWAAVALNCWVMRFFSFFFFFSLFSRCCFCLNTPCLCLTWAAGHRLQLPLSGPSFCWERRVTVAFFLSGRCSWQPTPTALCGNPRILDDVACPRCLLPPCKQRCPLPLLLMCPKKVTSLTFLHSGPQASHDFFCLQRRLAELSLIWDQFLVASRRHKLRRQTGCSLHAHGLCWALSALPTEADTVKTLPANIRLATAPMHCHTHTHMHTTLTEMGKRLSPASHSELLSRLLGFWFDLSCEPYRETASWAGVCQGVVGG